MITALSLFKRVNIEPNPQLDGMQMQLNDIRQKLDGMELQRMLDKNQDVINSFGGGSSNRQGSSGSWIEDESGKFIGGKFGDFLNQIDKGLQDSVNKAVDAAWLRFTAYIVAGLKQLGIALLDISSVVAMGAFVFYAYGVMAGNTSTKGKAMGRLYISAIAIFVIKILTVIIKIS